MDLRQFDVLKPSGTKPTLIERMACVIWRDNESSEVWLFYIEAPHRSPFPRLHSDLATTVKSGHLSLTTVTAEQTHHKSLTDLTDKEKNSMDRRWARICDLVDEKTLPLLLASDSRGRLLKTAATKHGVSYQMVLKDLYRFWSNGGNALAFVPRWYKCGGKGQIQKKGQRKRGRRAKSLDPRGARSTISSLPLSPEIRTQLLAGIKKFVKPHKPSKAAFEETLAAHFSDGYTLVDGKVLPIFDGKKPKPTFNQFNYLIGLEKKGLRLQKQLTPEIEWLLKNRPVTNRAAHQTFGPCHRYEIDATVVDIFLVCSFNRKWIVGRPILYVVIDVWSRVVVGFHLAFEGPSWYTARFALFSAFTNKQALCARYGRKITELEWPCHHLPLKILGDRGEMISKASDELPRSMLITPENAPPFRGDWKPFVEREFGLIQQGRVHFTPGAIVKADRVKGMRDPRLNACLTIHELGQIILECLLRRNRAPRDGAELPSEYVQAGHSVGSPIDVWRWGLSNMTGALRRFDEAQVLTNLLPSSTATVMEDGIHAGGIRYTSQSANAQEWFTRARTHKSFKVHFRVDSASPREAWVRRDTSALWECCAALDEDMILSQSTSEDILYKLERLTLERRQEEQTQRQDNLQSNARIAHIVDGAMQLTEHAQDGLTKSEKLASIKEKRSLEGQVQRRLLAIETNPSTADTNTSPSSPTSLATPKDTRASKLVRLAAAAWKGKQ